MESKLDQACAAATPALTVTLSESDPAITPATRAAHGLDTPAPVLRLMLRQLWSDAAEGYVTSYQVLRDAFFEKLPSPGDGVFFANTVIDRGQAPVAFWLTHVTLGIDNQEMGGRQTSHAFDDRARLLDRAETEV